MGRGVVERLEAIGRNGGVIEALWGDTDGWYLRALFPTREAIKGTYDRLVEQGSPPRVERIYDLSARDAALPTAEHTNV